jgi:hypothetical protein
MPRPNGRWLATPTGTPLPGVVEETETDLGSGAPTGTAPTAVTNATANVATAAVIVTFRWLVGTADGLVALAAHRVRASEVRSARARW